MRMISRFFAPHKSWEYKKDTAARESDLISKATYRIVALKPYTHSLTAASTTPHASLIR